MDQPSRSHRHRSRSRSPSSPRGPRQKKPSNFSSNPPRKSNFSDHPPDEMRGQMSTTEILDYYKQFNPNQSLTNHNKVERQLYVGNIPPGLTVPQLMELLNTTLKEMGKESGLFQEGDPIVGAWISGDGHYAFVDFRTADEATQGFALQQVSIHGSNLKVGRPKNATGPIPAQNQLLVGNAQPQMMSALALNKNKLKSSSSIVQNALKASMTGLEMQAIQAMNTKLLVQNFPLTHSKEAISKICSVFGKVKNIDLLKDPQTGEFRGHCHVEYETEMDAKRGFNGMMGFKIDDQVLFVKRLTTIAAPSGNMDGEVFKQLIEDKPTCCLVLKNCVKMEEIECRDDYKELEMDIEDEMLRYGKVLRVHVPRPPMFGDPYSEAGFGKAYVKFASEDEAERAKHGIYRRRFNGRVIDSMYYPEEKINQGRFD